ncbi:MAG: hypothetical protein CL610_08745 [Anaerolineaceae bacterium]|nr:hypothetical protein [Anaerolineaceae bacterium]
MNNNRIRPYSKNPFYWQYKGEPVLLLGGSIEDNLFQISDIEAHLDLLHAVGGNYVRCTMSSRDEGDVWPFERDTATGLYDLRQPGKSYWQRFERFLQLTSERDIILQIELWDRFDFARAPWQDNPYNPKNNINYTAADSGLKEVIDTHPGQKESNFFRSIPALENNTILLPYQQAQIDQLLSLSLNYGNVLYCIDNETNESPAWGQYWAAYIRQQASQKGVNVQITEMWDAWNLADPQHDATFNHPETYSFVDISQNNHQSALTHPTNIALVRQRLIDSGHIRPMNSVKIYGANSGRYGSTRDAQERFWRNIFGGMASSRFHRPPSGLGLGLIAQAHIRSMRMLTDQMDVTTCVPHNDLLAHRSWNEAFCLANPGVEYAVFFPDGGDIQLDVSAATGGEFTLRWLDIRDSKWVSEETITAEPTEGTMRLVTPQEEGYWAALVQHVNE